MATNNKQFQGHPQFLFDQRNGALSYVNRITGKEQYIAGQDNILHDALVCIGDSNTQFGQQLRATSQYDGVSLKPCTITTTNLGAGSWVISGSSVVYAGIGGGLGGTLATDGKGGLNWTATGDSSAGPTVDCTRGGWFRLTSGQNAASDIVVTVRGGTQPPGAAGTGAVTVSGIPTITDFDFTGYLAHMAGLLGATFKDYRGYGIPTCTSLDALKFTPQALANPCSAVIIQIGTNDPNSGLITSAAVSISNIKQIIDIACDTAPQVFVGDIYPFPGGTTTVQMWLAEVSVAIEQYCKTKNNCTFMSAYDKLIDPTAFTASSVTGKTGAFRADNLHTQPYGAYLVGLKYSNVIAGVFPTKKQRLCTIDAWDSTLQVGAWNPNPTLRGVAGAGSGSNGWTGTVPTSWTAGRSGATQTCVGSFSAAGDGGISWYTMTLGNGVAGEYSSLKETAAVGVPSGVNIGDYFQITCQLTIGGCTGNGLGILQMQANSTSNIQGAYPINMAASQVITTFTTENPVYEFKSEPQKLVTGVIGFDLIIRAGLMDGTSTAAVGFRNFRIEKCAGPILST